MIDYDVVILGGGAAGIAAAVAAAKKGGKVALIERNSFLGGKATAAEVGTVCGLYKFSKIDKHEYIVKGFVKNFAEDLRKKSNSEPKSNATGLHFLPYDIEAFKQLCAELLNDHNVDTYFGSFLYKVELENNSVKTVIIKQDDQHIKINLKSIIDCSGESLVSQLTNIPYIKSDVYQASAQIFTLKNIHCTNESQLGFILMKELKQAVDKKILEDYFDRVYIVQGSLKDNCVSLKIGIPVPVTHTADNLEALKDSAHFFIHKLIHFLTTNVSLFKHAQLMDIAPEVGIRVSYRTEGKYILTDEDVLSCRKFSDAIADATWPIEEWELNKRVKIRYFNLDDYYQIPKGCLQSVHLNNLFIAGRNISATDGAIASARVMGICLQTGYAAGKLAANHAMQNEAASITKTKLQYA